MSQQVIFKGDTDLLYTGRNGTGKCTGLDMLYIKHSQSVMLNPVNSKGKMTESCSVSVPVSELDEIIACLQKLKAEAAASGDKSNSQPSGYRKPLDP